MAVLIGSTIGSGIFRVPAGVAGELGAPGPFILVWVLGGVFALFGALTYAELAAAMPRSGGVFAFILEAFGPLPAFLFGWSELVVIRASALGAISTLFAEYLGYFLNFTPQQVHYVAAVAIIAVGLFNYLGVRYAAIVMNATTAAKYGALVLMGLLGFLAGAGDWAHFGAAPVASGTGVLAGQGGSMASLVVAALIPVMWTYDGWADLSFMGGEVKDPARTLPRALIIGTALIVAVYLLMNFAYLYLVPIEEMGRNPLIMTTAAGRIPMLGDRGTAVVAAMVMVSAFGGLLGSMMTGPRIFFAMADRGLFFQAIARVSPKRQSPSVAIWLATGLGVVYVMLNDFQELAEKFILGIWPFYALAVAAVFVLRKKRPDMARPYRAWGYPVVPVLFLLASVAMVLNALWTDPKNTGITFGIILLGVPAYGLWRWFAGRSSPSGK